MKKSICMICIALLLLSTAMVFSAGAAEARKSELRISSYMSDEAPKAVFEELVAEFERQNPDISVIVDTIAHEQFKTIIGSLLTSRNAPDVMTWFSGYRMQAFAKRGLLEPVGDVFPGGDFEAEFPAAFRGASSYDGEVYFVPQSWYWWAMYYNKQVFDEHGLEPPTTWDEFLNVCQVLKDGGVAPIAIGARDTWTAGGWFDYMNSAVNGGEFHQRLVSGEVPYTDPKVKESFSYLADLAERGYFMPNATAYSWQEAATQLFNGQAGMYLMGQFLHDVAPEDMKEHIDFFQFPIVGDVTEYSVDTPTDGFIMPKNAQNKEAAKKFMAFLAAAEAQQAFCEPLGRLAANVNVPVPNPQAQKGLDMVEGATFAMQFYDRDAPEEMAQRGMNTIVDILMEPHRMEALLAELDRERERIYAEEDF